MRFFAPQGRHVAPIWVKCGMEEVPSNPSSMPNFTPIGATIRVYSTQKLKFLLKFDQICRI